MNRPLSRKRLSIAFLCSTVCAQDAVQRVPLDDAIKVSLEATSLTSKQAQPFRLLLQISEPANPHSPYKATIEEWWASPEQWRREVKADGLHQIIVVSEGRKTETDEGDYFPLWLRKFVFALFDPVPDAAPWNAPGQTIDQTISPSGMRSEACTRVQSKIGSGPRATDAFSNICFDSRGRISFVGDPRYSMEFHDFSSFGRVDLPRRFVDHPEPGTEIVGDVKQIERLSSSATFPLFTPEPANDNRFESVILNPAQMEQATEASPPITWPRVHSGHLHGRLALYVSADRNGVVREVWPLNSDNPGLNDATREQVGSWVLNVTKDLNPSTKQIDGALGFSFDTTIGVPLPQLDDQQTRHQATRTVEPVWPTGVTQPGQTFVVEVTVDQTGKLAGETFGPLSRDVQGAILIALSHWTFSPLLLDGKPQYFKGMVRFATLGTAGPSNSSTSDPATIEKRSN